MKKLKSWIRARIANLRREIPVLSSDEMMLLPVGVELA